MPQPGQTGSISASHYPDTSLPEASAERGQAAGHPQGPLPTRGPGRLVCSAGSQRTRCPSGAFSSGPRGPCHSGATGRQGHWAQASCDTLTGARHLCGYQSARLFGKRPTLGPTAVTRISSFQGEEDRIQLQVEQTGEVLAGPPVPPPMGAPLWACRRGDVVCGARTSTRVPGPQPETIPLECTGVPSPAHHPKGPGPGALSESGTQLDRPRAVASSPPSGSKRRGP